MAYKEKKDRKSSKKKNSDNSNSSVVESSEELVEHKTSNKNYILYEKCSLTTDTGEQAQLEKENFRPKTRGKKEPNALVEKKSKICKKEEKEDDQKRASTFLETKVF